MQSESLLDRKGWVFDMDGTLTVAVHDFDAMRRGLELPAGVPILEAMDALDPAERVWREERLAEWEWELADRARAEPDALALVEKLASQGARMAVLTRNLRPVALRTLEVCGLLSHFDPQDILGRSCAPPKPSPVGIQTVLSRWGIAPSDAVMVGDFVFDIDAGRAAGTATVYVNREHGTGPAYADRVVRHLTELMHGGGH